MDPTRGRSRRWSLALGSAGLGLLSAELVCRAIFPAPMRVEVRSDGAPPLPVADTATTVVRHDERPAHGGAYLQTPTGRRLRPNTTSVIEEHFTSHLPVEIRTNSLGLRNREIGEKSGRRILFLGDSITLADYLPEEECFVRRVESLARAKGLDWETINAGVAAISLRAEFAILMETGLALRADVVVLGWYLNDFQESPGVEVRDLGFLVRHSRLAYALDRMKEQERAATRDVPINRWRAEWKEKDMPALAGGDPARATFYSEVESSFSDWGGAWSPHAWESMRPLLEELVRVARANGARPAFLAFPSRQQVEASFDTSWPQEELRRITAELEVPFLDILPLLRDLDARTEAPLFYDQCHHTPAASTALAEAIFAWLEQV